MLSGISFIDNRMDELTPIIKISGYKTFTIDVDRATDRQITQWIEIAERNNIHRDASPSLIKSIARSDDTWNRLRRKPTVSLITIGELHRTAFMTSSTDEDVDRLVTRGYRCTYANVLAKAQVDINVAPPPIPDDERGRRNGGFQFQTYAIPPEPPPKASKVAKEPNVRNIMGLHNQEGMFGIEIEIEGSRFPIVNQWEKKSDGSLRGEHAEYVLSVPLDREPAVAALEGLLKSFAEYETVRNYSYRTSVHVHVNVQKFRMNRLNVFVYLANLFEDALINYAGPSRLGNRFCLSNSTSFGNVKELEKFVSSKSIYPPSAERAKYMAINLAPIARFGSVEFRMMEGTDDVVRIGTWLSILEDLYKASEKWETIKDAAEFLEKEGFKKFFIKTFSIKNRKILATTIDVEASVLDAYKRLIMLPHKETKYD